jgi:hypothetical protein
MGSMEDQFGLMSTNFTPKPAYYAFKSFALAWAPPTPTSPPPPPPPSPAPPPPAPTPPPPAPAPAPPAPAPDAPPSVTLTMPTGGTFTNSISYAATAADDKGVAQVRFYFDGALVGSDTTAPYTATWSVPPWVSYDIHRVSATAVDTAGHQTSTPLVPLMRVKKRRNATLISSASRFSAAQQLRLSPFVLFSLHNA